MVMATDEKQWTIEALHRLPDDGNKYELVRGELFVTPAPRAGHELILARLTRLLVPYVTTHELGMVFHPRAVVRFDGSEVEPDLMVRDPQSLREADWDAASQPSLVVEVLSKTTRRRDLGPKRVLYLDAGIPEYWVVDEDRQSVRVIKPDIPDAVTTDELQWMPAGAREALVFDVALLFL